MTLLEATRNLAALNPEMTLYVRRPWRPDSQTIVELGPEDGSTSPPAAAPDYEYFLEVDIALDHLNGWRLNEGPKSVEEQCARLIHYAIYDA